MERIQKFEEGHGPAEQGRAVSAEVIEVFRSKLPDLLLDLWQDQGWCSYANGFIWTVDPQDYVIFDEYWMGGDNINPFTEAACIFARSAFGHLFVWDKGTVFYLNVPYGTFCELNDDIAAFFNETLCDEVFLREDLMHNLFTQAQKGPGSPAFDECYAFVPALAFGGFPGVENIKKVNLLVHLHILFQLHAG